MKIDPKTKTALPKKFHYPHNLCVKLHDQMVEILTDKYFKSLRKITIDLKKPNQQFISELKKGKIHVLEWLKLNNLNEELDDLLTGHLTLSILSDFLQFISSSLDSAKQGKMSVAYSLLRKPLTDELLILEQLSFNPKEFIHRFFHDGNPAKYDPSKIKDPKKQQEIIRNAISKIQPNILFREDILYNLRYNKAIQSGINGISNQALHIVTTDSGYKTENQNLNFTFSNEEDLKKYWDHYYYFIPYLLFYTSALIDAIIFQPLNQKNKKSIEAIRSFRRLIGILLWTDQNDKKNKKINEEMWNIIVKYVRIDCTICKTNLKFDRADFQLFFDAEVFLCPQCLQNVMVNHKSIEPMIQFMTASKSKKS